MHLLHKCNCPWKADAPPARAYLGRYGELVAASYLRAHGVRILRCNVPIGGGELDIVGRHGDTLVACEVKSTATPKSGAPGRMVNARKRKHMRQGLQHWLYMLKKQPPTRFDIVEVYLTGRSRPEIVWSQHAFTWEEGAAWKASHASS